LKSISDHCKTLKCLPIIDQQSAVAADDAVFDMAMKASNIVNKNYQIKMYNKITKSKCCKSLRS
jgi:hypothetical protein